jgi:hypothetical protein
LLLLPLLLPPLLLPALSPPPPPQAESAKDKTISSNVVAFLLAKIFPLILFT